MPLPALRPVEAIPVDHEGQRLVCLSDPTGTVPGQLVLSPLAYLVASCLTGSTEIGDIQKQIAEVAENVEAPAEDIQRVIDHLDENGFLFSPRFQRLQGEIEDQFHAADARPAWLAGGAYPGDPHELRTALDALYEHPDGPGTRPDAPTSEASPLAGLIVPHIDYPRGGHSYAHGYAELARHGRPDTVIVFGVAHMAEPTPFILTRKPFDTPLGIVETDTDCLDRLEAACTWDPYEYELTHRTEHSVELQAVMIAHALGPDTRIVPVLCSMFPDESDPADDPHVAAFLQAAAEYAGDPANRVTVIASADLAHVGRRFGDDIDIDDAIIGQVRARDEDDLAHAHRIDAAGFYESVMIDENARKVCGVNCIYATLKTLEGRATSAKPLHYGYAPDPAGGIVSFASLALT